MKDLREAFRIAVERVARDRWLAEGWEIEVATDWIWAQPPHHLVGERGWSPGDYEERSVRQILGEVLATSEKAALQRP